MYKDYLIHQIDYKKIKLNKFSMPFKNMQIN